MKKNKHRQRTNNGFSLISTILFTSFSIGLMLTVVPLTFNVLRREGVNKTLSELQVAAEMGIDYGTKTLNNQLSLNLGPLGVTWPSTVVPLAALPTATKATIKTQLSQISPSSWASFCPSYFPDNRDNWRILDSTATIGGFSKSIRVLLEPRYEALAVTADPPSLPFFDSSLSQEVSADLLANSNLNIVIDATTKPKGFKFNAASPGPIQFNNTPITALNLDPQSANLADAPRPAESQLLPNYTNSELLPPSSYQVSDIPSNFHAKIDLASSQAPVKFFISDYLSTQPSITINSSSFSYFSSDGPASSGNFQIFYNGTRPLNLNLSSDAEFRGVIYTPNTTVTITTAGDSKFFGALASSQVQFTNSDPLTLNIDSAFSETSKLQQMGQQGEGLTYTGTYTLPDLQGYRVVSWTEYSGVLVP